MCRYRFLKYLMKKFQVTRLREKENFRSLKMAVNRGDIKKKKIVHISHISILELNVLRA